MKEEFLTYLKLWNPNIIDVISFRLNDWDDDDGFIGENYTVRVLMDSVNSETTSIDFLKIEQIERNVLVNKRQYNFWLEKESAIRFID